MPTYSFSCQKCEYDWDQYYSFDDFDKLVKPGKIKCPKCKKKAQDRLHAPNINVGQSIGAIAEKNSKDLGTYGLQKKYHDDDEKRVKPKKEHKPWYGKMSREKMKDIFGEKNQKEKQKKINKYIREGK